MNYVDGDLLQLAEQGQFDCIVHGCNCFNTFGAGLAKQIKNKYPLAYDVDTKTNRGDYNKLGNYTVYDNSKFKIINAYTQYGTNIIGISSDIFDYISFVLILQKLAHNYPNSRFGFPYIGCGLAGGDKLVIISMLENFSEQIASDRGSVTLVNLK